MRRETITLNVGGVLIGSQHPIVVQSMCNTDTRDVFSTLKQINELKTAGCQLVRLAVVDTEAVDALNEICRKSSLPVIADIHFDYKLALGSLKAGVSGLRINPGNIGSKEKVIKIEPSKRNLRKRRLFAFLDEEEAEGGE